MKQVRTLFALAVVGASVVLVAGCSEIRSAGAEGEPAAGHVSAGAASDLDQILSAYGTGTGYDTNWPAFRELVRVTDTAVGGDYDPDVFVDPTTGKVQLAFASTRHCKMPNIYLKPLPGVMVVRKTEGETGDIQPAFSPDGTRIAFASFRAGNWDIFVMPTSGAAVATQLTKADSYDFHPSWSPDGKEIVYVSYVPEAGRWEIRIVDVEGTYNRAIGFGCFPQWSPTGQTILYQRPRGRDENWFAVWTVRPDGTGPTEIVASDKWAAITPAWSPDGKYIVFATVHKSPLSQEEKRISKGDDIWIVRADGTELTQLTAHPAPDWNPVWASDGNIYFCSDRSGHANIWSVKPPFEVASAGTPATPARESDEGQGQ